jgi:tRNA modification GTPase
LSTFAAVTTGKGTGAISTIQVFGDKAQNVIKSIFKPLSSKAIDLNPGHIYLGNITAGQELLDQVTVGCEEPDCFAIHCHANPIIIADIMKLLSRNNVTPLNSRELLKKIELAKKPANTIELEAKLTAHTAKTIQGTKLIANQIRTGLTKQAIEWLNNIEGISLGQIKSTAQAMIEKSQTAGLIIKGCTAVLAGPANSGKSTLLNCLAGREKAIVSDIKGTTRDWITGQCCIGPMLVDIIDTAGHDIEFTDEIGKQAQQKTAEMLNKADLVLLVLDMSENHEQITPALLERFAGKKIVTILNKSDLPARLDISKLPQSLPQVVSISAKFGDGIEKLTEKIQQTCGVADFDLKTAVCFTPRQQLLIEKLSTAESKRQATSIIEQLLNGQISV